MGRLTKDPEIRYPQSEEATIVGRFSIAVDRRYKQEGGPTADFFNCVCFGRQAEFIEKYLSKGKKIVLTGRVENNNYTDRDGRKVYATQIRVEEMEFAESKTAEGDQKTSSSRAATNTKVDDGFMTIPDGLEEELPFM